MRVYKYLVERLERKLIVLVRLNRKPKNCVPNSGTT
jgi:hypothetical protein